jgi:hypothetical protein
MPSAFALSTVARGSTDGPMAQFKSADRRFAIFYRWWLRRFVRWRHYLGV